MIPMEEVLSDNEAVAHNVGEPDGLTEVELALLEEAEKLRAKPSAYEEYKMKEEAAKKAAEEARKEAAERYKANLASMPMYGSSWSAHDDLWWKATYDSALFSQSHAPAASSRRTCYPAAGEYPYSSEYPRTPTGEADIHACLNSIHAAYTDLTNVMWRLETRTGKFDHVSAKVKEIHREVTQEDGVIGAICKCLYDMERDNEVMRTEVRELKESVTKLCTIVIATLAPPCEDAPPM
jgi:hypothetical protein